MLTHKRCEGPCGQDKDIDQFHWKSKRHGTRQARCKVCMSEYAHQHYLQNAQEYKDRANGRLKVLRAENQELVKSHLLSHPCSRCGESNSKVLDVNITSIEINNLAPTNLSAKLQLSTVLCKNCQAKSSS